MTAVEILSISIAGIAVVLSFVTVILGRRERQLDAFAKIQELLLDRDAQEGRRILYQASRDGVLPADQTRFDLANRAVANFNTVAILVRHKVIPRQWLLEDWHHTLRQMRVGYDSIVATGPEKRTPPRTGSTSDTSSRMRRSTGASCRAAPVSRCCSPAARSCWADRRLRAGSRRSRSPSMTDGCR
jgi:hypothetical protein